MFDDGAIKRAVIRNLAPVDENIAAPRTLLGRRLSTLCTFPAQFTIPNVTDFTDGPSPSPSRGTSDRIAGAFYGLFPRITISRITEQ